jgi:hypothetical protein
LVFNNITKQMLCNYKTAVVKVSKYPINILKFVSA